MERCFELARALTALPSVSGCEEQAFEGLEKICDGIFDESRTNPAGSFVGVVRCGRPAAATASAGTRSGTWVASICACPNSAFTARSP